MLVQREQLFGQEATLEFTVELVTPADDTAICELLASNPIPGAVGVTFEREPSYFLGCAVHGHFCQVLGARYQPEGVLVGIGCRSIRRLFINGSCQEVGYLSQLRVDQKFQGYGLVTRGFRLFRQLHSDGRVTAYLASITEENVIARSVLVERARRQLPVFREVCRLHTLALVLRRPTCLPRSPYQVRRGSPDQLGAIVAFLQTYGAERQFFPVYSEADFCGGPATRGFVLDDFLVAYRGSTIVGVIGLWDQSSYKQTVVRSYRGALQWGRPLYNLAARWLGARPLPLLGQQLRLAYASFVCVAPQEQACFAMLLHSIYNLASQRGYTYLMIGLADNDPLLPVARRYLHIPYRSRLYTVCWEDGMDFHERLDGRIPYLEIATL